MEKIKDRLQELIDDKEALNDVKLIIEINTKEVATELVEQYVIFNKQDIHELMDLFDDNKETNHIKDLIDETVNDTFTPFPSTFEEFKKEIISVWEYRHNKKD